jgi:hypothetical protein
MGKYGKIWKNMGRYIGKITRTMMIPENPGDLGASRGLANCRDKSASGGIPQNHGMF